MQIQYTKIDGDIKSFCDKTDYTYIWLLVGGNYKKTIKKLAKQKEISMIYVLGYLFYYLNKNTMTGIFLTLSMIMLQPFITPWVTIQNHARDITKTFTIMQQVHPEFLTGCTMERVIWFTTSVVVIKWQCLGGETTRDVRIGIDYKNHIRMRKWHTQESRD
jgi:hypothetical protein